jgi:hypothetical protein
MEALTSMPAFWAAAGRVSRRRKRKERRRGM